MVPAAGLGERARSPDSLEPKQFRLLGGKPVVAWALEAVAEAGCSPIVLVLPESQSIPPELRGVDTDLLVTTGGPSRQESVGRGLELVDTETVVVHDAARPFAPAQLVTEVIATLQRTGVEAVVPGIAMDETLKVVDSQEDLVLRTVDRTGLWRAQTPAAFQTAALKEAHSRARAEGFIGTDESQLVERFAGGRVMIVAGRRDNLKITFPEDLALAEAMLGLRN